MHVTLICMDRVEFNAVRVLMVITVEGKLFLCRACARVNRFVPTICSKQVHMPKLCVYVHDIDVQHQSESFPLCGFSSFHSLPCSFSKKGKAPRSELRQVR